MEEQNNWVLQMAKLSVLSNILANEYNGVDYAPEGKTVSECYAYLQVDPLLKPYVRAFVRGGICHDWETITVEGDSVIFAVMPSGGDDDGKGALAIVAMIAVMVFAQWAGPALAANMAGGAAIGAVGAPATVLGMHYITAGAVITAGIGIVGSLAIGAIFKPSIPGMDSPTSSALESFGSPTALIVGQSNQLRKDGVIPKIFGQHTIFPDIVALPYVDKHNCSQVLHAIYCLGNGIVELVPDSLRLGGVPWAELRAINPGMDYKSWVGRTGAVGSKLGYNGRRFFQSENKVITKKDPILDTVWTYADFPSDIAGNRMFFALTYPQGISSVDQALGDRIYYESKLAVQVLENIGGAYRNLAPGDFSGSSGASQIICTDDNGEAYLEGSVVENSGISLSFGEREDIIDRGGEGSGIDDTELNVIDEGNIYGGRSDVDGQRAGWNGGLHGIPLPNRDASTTKHGIDNGKNSMPFDAVVGYKNAVYNIDKTLLSNIYYTHKYDANDRVNDGDSFIEGTITCVWTVAWPRLVDEHGDAGSGTGTPVHDLTIQPFIAGYNENGDKSSKVRLAVGAQVTVDVLRSANLEDSSTTVAVSRKFGKNSPFKILQFGLSYDVGKKSPRRVAINLVKASFGFRASVITPGIQTDAKMVAKFPIATASNTNGVIPPRVGDILYMAQYSDQPCYNIGTYCRPLPEWYKINRGHESLKSFGIPHQITRVAIKGAPEIDGNQTYQPYTLDLDNPITESKFDAVYFSHATTPGIKLKAKYTSPIHFGLELKMFAGVRFGKTETQTPYDVDTVQLTSTEVIQDTDIFAYIRDEQNITYTFLEIKVPANDIIGQQLKPLSCTVMAGARDRSAAHYNADLPDQDPVNKDGAVAVYDENPAWSYLSVMTGAAGGRPLRLHGSIAKLTDTVDLEAFRRWADFCTEHNFRFSYIITGYSTIGELLNVIAGTGRGRPTFRDGKHSILFDGDEKYFEWWTDAHGKRQAKAIVRQIISPENSWSGSAKLEYLGDVHGLRVSYLNKHTRKMEFVDKYLSGFAEVGTDYYSGGAPPWQATKIENMNMPGVAYQAQVETLAEYYIKQVQLRRERISRSMDVEALISHEGDIVSVVDDVMRLGGKASKIVEIFSDDLGSGGTMRRAKVRLDDPIPMYKGTPTPIVGIKIRHFDATTGQPKLSEAYEVEIDPFSTGAFDVIAFSHSVHVGIQVRTMVLWGIMDKISQDYQISAISYSADMTAILELLEYYPDPLYYDGDRNVVGETPTVGHVPIPKNVTLEILWNDVSSESWSIKYVVNWDSVPGLISTGGSYMIRFTEQIKNFITQDTHITSHALPLNCGDLGGTMGVHVFAIDAYGNVSNRSDVIGLGYARVVRQNPNDVPSDVVNFCIEIKPNGAFLTWDASTGSRVTGYEIRWSEDPLASPDWDTNTEVQVLNTPNLWFNSSRRSGIFYIKSKGMCGQVSANYKIIISDFEESPELTRKIRVTVYSRYGTQLLTGCAVEAGMSGYPQTVCDLILRGVKIGKTYDLETWTEVGGLNPRIGLKTDMTNYVHESGHSAASGPCFKREGWMVFDPDYYTQKQAIPLHSEIYMTHKIQKAVRNAIYCPLPPAAETLTSVQMYYRTWSGSVVPSIRSGWRLIAGDMHILEHFQFAIKFSTNDGHFTPVIDNAWVYKQFYLRSESDNDVTCPIAGITIAYDREFMKLPALSIMGQDLKAGDTWRVSSPTTTGFSIKFYDSSGRAKEASFDWIAAGRGVKR